MTASPSFSGRDAKAVTGGGHGHSGAGHDRFMRRSAYALAPLGLIVAWILASLAGKPFDAARDVLAHPLPALALIAFFAIGMQHARLGAESIIIDYVHDEAMKQAALRANKWASLLVTSIGVVATLLIAAPK
jgi:succinate dehydrogenase / fumarate reductase membrane anchor subunit